MTRKAGRLQSPREIKPSSGTARTSTRRLPDVCSRMPVDVAKYGWALIAFLALALITWGPTFVRYRRLRQYRVAVRPRHLWIAFTLELLAVLAFAGAINAAGIADPGGYVLLVALVTGAGGAQIFSRTKYNA